MVALYCFENFCSHLIHRRRFPDAGVAEDDQFQKRSLSCRKERKREEDHKSVCERSLEKRANERDTRREKKKRHPAVITRVDASNTKRAQNW